MPLEKQENIIKGTPTPRHSRGILELSHEGAASRGEERTRWEGPGSQGQGWRPRGAVAETQSRSFMWLLLLLAVGPVGALLALVGHNTGDDNGTFLLGVPSAATSRADDDGLA